MEIVYLSGFVQLLQDALGALFDAILSPLLRDVFNILVNFIGQLIQQIFSNFLLRLWIIFLKLIYFIEQIFNVFSGISPVEIKDAGERMSLLQYFFTMDEFRVAFITITMISVALAFLTTIIGVVKSMSDMALNDKTPISTVLRQAFQAALTFMLVPVCCLFLLHMSTTMVTVVNSTFNYDNENVSVSDVLFMAVAEPAVKESDPSARAKVIKTYSSGQNYANAEAVEEAFQFEKFNFFQAYVSSIGVALILLCSILQFIQRIVMIVLLYLVSPFFVSMMPLDGGAKFREWRNMFVAHMISAFAPIITMKVFFILIPFVTNGDLNFNVGSTETAWVKIFFILGGAYAVYKSRLLIISIVNPAAAGSMSESGMIGAAITGRIGGGLNRAVRNAGRDKGKDQQQNKKNNSGGGSSQNQYQTQSQAYTGK